MQVRTCWPSLAAVLRYDWSFDLKFYSVCLGGSCIHAFGIGSDRKHSNPATRRISSLGRRCPPLQPVHPCLSRMQYPQAHHLAIWWYPARHLWYNRQSGCLFLPVQLVSQDGRAGLQDGKRPLSGLLPARCFRRWVGSTLHTPPAPGSLSHVFMLRQSCLVLPPHRRALNVLLTNPIWLIATRMQIGKSVRPPSKVCVVAWTRGCSTCNIC